MAPIRTLLAAGLVAAAGSTAMAEEVTVKMVNSGPGGPMSFDPAIVKIKPGDSVKFASTDKGHMVETIKGMEPEGAPAVKGQPNKDETVKFDKEGVYGFKCTPHFAMGMVALVVVGSKLDNLEQAKSAQTNANAKKRLDPLFAEVKQ